jgi:hypothetical protein
LFTKFSNTSEKVACGAFSDNSFVPPAKGATYAGCIVAGRLTYMVLAAALCLLAQPASAEAVVRHDFIELELRPRVCTLSARDEECDTVVQAQWRSPRDESLCLLIVGRPEIKRCWEGYSEGVYTMKLAFSEDLVVELRDPELQRVLVAEAVTVIKEALRLRRKRRQPWSPF